MTFRAYALLGFGAAVAAGSAAAARSGLELTVVAAQAAASAAVFLTLAYRSTRDGGPPNLIWQRYILAAGVASVAASAAAGFDALASLDVFATGAAAQLVFGRLGCRVAGCCHGRRGRGGGLLPVAPTEAAANAALCGWALIVAGHPQGAAALVVITGQSALRFALEELRGDGGRLALLGLTEAQWVGWGCCVAVAAGIAGTPHPAALATAALITVLALVRVGTAARSDLASRLLAPAARCQIAELAARDDAIAPFALAGCDSVLASAATVEDRRVVTLSSSDDHLRGRWLRTVVRPGRVVAQRPVEDVHVVHVVG
jgi:hypothetical protein